MRGRTWRNDIEGLYVVIQDVFFTVLLNVSALLLVAGWVPFAQILERLGEQQRVMVVV